MSPALAGGFSIISATWEAPMKCPWTLVHPLNWSLLLSVFIWLAWPPTCWIFCKWSRAHQSGDRCLLHSALLLKCPWPEHLGVGVGRALVSPARLALLWWPRPSTWNLHHQHHCTSDEATPRGQRGRTESALKNWWWIHMVLGFWGQFCHFSQSRGLCKRTVLSYCLLFLGHVTFKFGILFFLLLEGSCFVGLCHTSTWISHRYTYVPSFLNTPHSHLPPHPSPLGCHTARGWTLCIRQQIPTCCLFNIW